MATLVKLADCRTCQHSRRCAGRGKVPSSAARRALAVLGLLWLSSVGLAAETGASLAKRALPQPAHANAAPLRAAHADSPLARLNLNDPTRPPPMPSAEPARQAASAPPLGVSLVLLAGKQSYAVVAERPVQVGDVLGEEKVVRIDERGVWLRSSAGTRLLALLPGQINRSVSREGKTGNGH